MRRNKRSDRYATTNSIESLLLDASCAFKWLVFMVKNSSSLENNGRSPSGRATIVALGARHCVVCTPHGELREGLLSQELARRQRSDVAVGDRVRFELHDERGISDDILVTEVEERETALSRPDPHRRDIEHLIVANVDVVVVVVAARRPPLHARLIDRYLVAIDRGGARAVLCVNKIDLVDDARARGKLDEALAPYRTFELPIVECSAVTGAGIEELRHRLSGHTCAFVGHSGVGKSSIANAIDPELDALVGAVRDADGKGRHTTTEARMYELRGGIRLIDTPGIRSFGLWDITRTQLAWYFPDFEDYLGTCRFHNCTHTHEPACGIKEAVELGEILDTRYETYLRMIESLGEKR